MDTSNIDISRVGVYTYTEAMRFLSGWFPVVHLALKTER
jgi:hypothetical protein